LSVTCGRSVVFFWLLWFRDKIKLTATIYSLYCWKWHTIQLMPRRVMFHPFFVFFVCVTLVFPTNKTNRHDITEILLKVALNTIQLKPRRVMLQSFTFCYLPHHRNMEEKYPFWYQQYLYSCNIYTSRESNNQHLSALIWKYFIIYN
jgi:hypothetical protein